MDQAHRNKLQEIQERRFIQIPLEIFFDSRLTPSDKIIYGRINTFGKFYETNTRTAELLGLSDKQVARSKRRLEELGYIVCIGDDGRGRIYTTNEKRLDEIREEKAEAIKDCPGIEHGDHECTCGAWRFNRTNCPDGGTNCPTENKERLKRELKEKQTKEKNDDQPKTYGNADVNAMLDAWAEATGFDYKNQKNERYAISGLIKTHGTDGLNRLIRLVGSARRSGDRFAPQIAKPSQLRGKYSKFEALTMWAEKRDKADRPTGPSPALYKTPDWIKDEKPDQHLTQAERHAIAEKHRAALMERLEARR